MHAYSDLWLYFSVSLLLNYTVVLLFYVFEHCVFILSVGNKPPAAAGAMNFAMLYPGAVFALLWYVFHAWLLVKPLQHGAAFTYGRQK